MSRTLTVARVGTTTQHPRGWHWSLKLGPAPNSVDVVYYHAVNGSTWTGFQVRERRSTTNSSSMNVQAGYTIGTIEEGNVAAAQTFMLQHPCSTAANWNCQDWVRSCINELHEESIIDDNAYNGFWNWNNRIVGAY